MGEINVLLLTLFSTRVPPGLTRPIFPFVSLKTEGQVQPGAILAFAFLGAAVYQQI